jgi:hypothetical protein
MPFLIDQLTLLHRQLHEMLQEQKEAIQHMELENDMQAIDEAFKAAFKAYENAPDEDGNDTLEKHQKTECHIGKYV